MNFDDFKRYIEILPKEKATELRYQYIHKFIDVDNDYYKKYIQRTKRFSDGIGYTGYLWDCLKVGEKISFSDFRNQLIEFNDNVIVFWDLHSKDKIIIQDYWKFGKESLIKLNSAKLIHGLNFLPEDIYVFDKSVSWSLILTHEYINDERWCLKI